MERVQGMTTKRTPCRLLLTLSMLPIGKPVVTAMADGGAVMWLGLALQCFLLCRASEVWAYANGQVHPVFCLMRGSLIFFWGDAQLAFNIVTRPRTRCRCGCGVQECPEESMLYDHSHTRCGHNARGGGRWRARSELFSIGVHPQLPGETPLTARLTPGERRVFTRTKAAETLTTVVGSS